MWRQAAERLNSRIEGAIRCWLKTVSPTRHLFEIPPSAIWPGMVLRLLYETVILVTVKVPDPFEVPTPVAAK